MKRFFIAGTDTDIGKTLVSTALLELAKGRGLKTAALKPVAAGCELSGEGLQNDDALALQRAITEPLPYSSINPVALEPAIAPHIAAAQIDKILDAESLHQACEPVLSGEHDFLLAEGAGGWRVPLNAHETMADIATAMQMPVILVVGMRLGCISHALLTAEAIVGDGLPIAAWVANQVDADMPYVDENLASLAHRFDFPCLGHIPFLSNPSAINAAEFLDIGKLLDV